jgi:N-acetylglucosamine-6-phosphate deacetylase
MSAGDLIARHFRSGRLLCFRWENGLFTRISPANHPSQPAWAIAPTLFDGQINGFAGIDFQQDNITADDLLHAVRQLRQAGCGQFLLTLITDAWDSLLNRLSRLRQFREASLELKQAIAGWHLEGPFLSSEPGYHGTHNPALMCDPTPAHLHQLRKLTGDDLVLLTLAPERRGALESIACAVSLAMRVNLGHTDADAHCLHQALQAGATGFTHLGNACKKELDRFDNILWRVLDLPEWRISLIPDGIHVSAPLFRLIHRAHGHESIYYVSDAISAAASAPGQYRLGSLVVEAGADQTVRQPGQTYLAGSALRPLEGVMRAASMLHGSWQEAWWRYSDLPRQHLGLATDLAVGQPADFCLLKTDENRLVSGKLFLQGEEATPLNLPQKSIVLNP